MSMSLEGVLSERSKEELIKTLSSIDIFLLSKIALITNDEQLLDYTDSRIIGNSYNKSAICQCTDVKMLTKIIDKMSDDRAYRLFEKNAYNYHNDQLFMLLIKKLQLTESLIGDLLFGSYSFGLKYCMRNFPMAMNYVRGNTNSFEQAIANNCLSILDIFYVHCDINVVDLKNIVYSNSDIYSTTFNRLIEYGYNLHERFMTLDPKKKERLRGETYLYFHNRGLCYNKKIMTSIMGASSKKTYKYIPEEDRPLCSGVFLSRANYLKRVKYADRLVANRATDLVIVCNDV